MRLIQVPDTGRDDMRCREKSSNKIYCVIKTEGHSNTYMYFRQYGLTANASTWAKFQTKI
jgi:hypothetical protein